MSDLIKSWLLTHLGIIFDKQTWDDDIGGGIIAQLLHSYALLTEEQVKIIHCKDDELYKETMEVMRLAIVGLGIDITKNEFQDVLDAKGLAPTKLLYELYLVLHDKDPMHFILAQQLQEPLKSSRFSVSVHDSVEDFQIEKFNNPLAAPLRAKEEIVDYHMNKHLDLMNKCKKSRELYLNFMNEKRLLAEQQFVTSVALTSSCDDGFHVEDLPVDAESLNQSVTDLVNETKHAERMQSVQPDAAVSNKIIEGIKIKAKKTHKMREVRETFRKTILQNLWEKLLQDQEDYFKNQFTQKLQQQSVYEQDMAAHLMKVRQNRDIITEEKRVMIAYIRAEEEKVFIDKLYNEDKMKDNERINYYMEMQRKQLLHRKLYERKMKRRQDRIKNEVSGILNDILDITFYTVEYNETHCETISRRKRDDLARLFVGKQPIFDQLEDVTEVISTDVTSTTGVDDDNEAEVISMIELDRQNALDDLTFEDYHTFKWPWDFRCWLDFEYYQDMTLGLNVLAHIIYRLLLGKYPRRPLPVEPAIPKTEVAVCVNGLDSLTYLPALEQLLKSRKIKIVKLQDAFDHCVSVFKAEATTEYLDGLFEVETEEAPKEGEKKKKAKKSFTATSKKGSKKSSKKSSKKGRASETNGDGDGRGDGTPEKAEFVDKINQTPKLFPDEELVLSPAGDVGRSLDEVLTLGKVPNNYVSAAAIVEYLKTLGLPKLDGWVLINYPQTIQQAIILEETLSSTRIPIDPSIIPNDSLADIVDILEPPNNTPKDEEDTNEKRQSKLLENPKTFEDDDWDYDTFLTAFIELKSSSGDDQKEQLYDCFKSASNTSILSKFYQDQGCKYTLFYKTLDFGTIKHLGKMILGDYSMPPKDSHMLFSDTVDYVEANFDDLVKDTSTAVKEGEKVKKNKKKDKKKPAAASPKESGKSKKKKESKKSSKASSGKKGKKKGGAKDKEKLEIETDDKETQIPTPALEPEDGPEEVLPPPLPGEYRWKYYDLPIDPYYEVALATLWENVEDIYITDMKQLFFRRRTLLDSLIPYNSYVKINMMEFIARPDIKQKYLQEFQACYNEFEDDMREDEEVKAELHMRIEEFREKLWKICDARMLENENERVRIVQENWVTTLLIELCNIYTSFIQLEVDRSTDTCQLIIDYYSAIISAGPYMDPPLAKIKLDLIKLPSNIEDLDHVAPFVEFTEDIFQQSNKNLNANNSPFINKIRVVLETAQGKIDSTLACCNKIKNDLTSKFNPKASKGKKKGSVQSEVIEPDEEIKHRAAELLQELEAAYIGEYYRCDLRLKIIEHVLIEEVQDVLDKGAMNFRSIYQEIERRYRSEIHAVDEAARLLKRAVEEETMIQPEMLFEGDMFYVKLGTLMYESPLPDDDTVPVREPSDSEMFTVSQLDRIADILFRLSPNGIIPERAFAFLLQEFLVHTDEDGKEDFVPKMWKRLDPHKTHKLMNRLFGVTEYIDWKDFILYCLRVRFPDENQILNVRQQFRNLDPDMTEFIYEHQYPDIHFWFDGDLAHPRLKHTRELLFKLYHIDDRLNYTALLLAFCKDVNPIRGLVKALEVSLGTLVCYDESRGSVRYAKSLKRIMQRELDSITRNIDRRDTETMSREVVEKLIDDTIHNTNSAVITVLDNDPEPLCTYDIIQYLQQATKNRTSYAAEECNENEESTESVSEAENTEYYFTNTGSQGHSAADGMEYQIRFDVISNVFNVMIPWIHKIRRFGEVTFHERFALIYNSLINEDITVAYIYQIMIHEDFTRMFLEFYKYYDRDPVEIVRELIDADN